MKKLGIAFLCVWFIASTVYTLSGLYETRYNCQYKYNLTRDNYCVLLPVPKTDFDTIKLYLKDVYLLENEHE